MRDDVPPRERRKREHDAAPATTYRIHWRDGVETESWRVAAAWSGVGVRVTAVQEAADE